MAGFAVSRIFDEITALAFLQRFLFGVRLNFGPLRASLNPFYNVSHRIPSCLGWAETQSRHSAYRLKPPADVVVVLTAFLRQFN
jgi:hypothetical protein